MKPPRKYLFAIVGVAALCSAMNSTALTLGRAKGSVFFGQTLRLTVPVQMEVGEGTAALCFEADVFYGDTRQDASRVSVTSVLQRQSHSVNVTISAQGAVDEPVVTVYLRAGCDGKTTRRYVLLTEVAAPEPSPVPSLSASTQQPQAKHSDGIALRTPKAGRGSATDIAPSASGETPVSTQRGPKLRRVPNRREQLKLESLDWAQNSDPTLKLSAELIVEEREDLQKRAQAEALWRSLNISPQDILSLDSRRQTLASDLRHLQSVAAKNQQLLDGMARRLERAESGRYANPLIHGLLLAITGCGLAVAWLWRRRARAFGLTGEPWWRDEEPRDKPDVVEVQGGNLPNAEPAAGGNGEVQPEMIEGIGAVGVPVQSTPAGTCDDIDVSKNITGREEKVSVVAQPIRLSQRAMGHADFGQSMSASLLRSVNSKEMLDVRQQAEFFMTLGQNEEAIALLRDSLNESPDADPLVYLELLKVLHTLGRKVEYDHYRNGFHAIFNGYIPVYSEYGQPGSGLEAYPVVCRRIVGLWPSEEVVSYIESCLVRASKEKEGQIFDLDAFRDLLLLHAIASQLTSKSLDVGSMAFSVARAETLADSARSGLDVDLDLSATHDGNLIDFDASDWSAPQSGADRRK